MEIIVFDLDGTLYDMGSLMKSVYRAQIAYWAKVKNVTEKEAERTLNQNGIYDHIEGNSKSATEFFIKNGICKNKWSEFRNQFIDYNNLQIHSHANKDIFIRLKKKYSLFLLSTNTYTHVKKIFDKIDFSMDIFQEIICSDKYEGEADFNKKNAFQYIHSKYEIEYASMLTVGDRYATDISPLLELGGKGVLVSNPLQLNNFDFFVEEVFKEQQKKFWDKSK